MKRSAGSWWGRGAVTVLPMVTVLLLPAVAAHASLSAPDDPFFSHQWNMTKIGAPAAWSRSTGQKVIIGVVDTGVDLQHEDLSGKVLATTNCVGSGGASSACTGSGQDDNGHGTHVSGIAAADTDNGKGVVGTAPDAKLVVAKALDNQGSGNFNDVNAGIEWVVDHGARVVNLSLGSDLPAIGGVVGGSITTGVNYAWAHGAIPVIAAGNQNFFGLGSSNYGNVNAVIVGATGPNDEVAPYSSPLGNAKWALVAPGGDGADSQGNATCDGPAQASCIVSTWWSSADPSHGYAYDQGTSMATPMVSGVLALLLAQGRTPTAAVNALLSGADKSVACGPGCAGRLDAAKAVGAVVSAASAGLHSPAGGSAAPGPGSRTPSGSGGGSPTRAGPGFTGPAVSPPLAPGVGVVAGRAAPSAPVLPTTTPTGPTAVPGAAPVSSAQGPRQVSVVAAPRHGRGTPSSGSLAYVAGGLAILLLVGVAGVFAYLRRGGLTAASER